MKRWLLLLNIFCLPAASFAGHSVNNGVDRSRHNDHVVWFADAKRPIRACVEVADDFGVDAATAAGEVTKAFAIWEQYLAAKKIMTEIQGLGLGISTKVSLTNGCSGDEDLKIFLGVTNPEVNEAAKDFNRPLAFAARQAYDEAALWGRGLIWVTAPSTFARENLDWSKKNHLLGILLHEIGHVLGCGHVAGTIMREDLSKVLLDNAPRPQDTLGQIDSGRQLILCPGCQVSYDARLLRPEPLAKLLKTRLGPDATARMTMNGGTGSLTIVDGPKTFTLSAARGGTLASESSDVPLLSIPARTDFGGYTARTTGYLALLTLSYEGRELTLGYRRNMDFTVYPERGFVDQLLTLDPGARSNEFIRLDPINP